MSTSDASGGSADGDRVLVAEYALGLLDAAEHERLANRLAVEPELRRELALWRRRLVDLDHEFAEAPAPAGVLARVEARLFPAAPRRAGLWDNLNFWRGVAAACLIVALGALGYTALAPRPALTGSELVAALEAAGSNVKLVAFYDAATGTVRLAALSGEAVPDKDFELWAIKGTNAPVSMGVIPINARSDVVVPAALRAGFGPGTVLAVTLEQKGGSPTGAPQGPVVAKGATTPI
jgi:anti-sigma-K factor RskA